MRILFPLTKIPDYFFYGCSSLINIKIQSFFTEIGKYLFYGCSLLTNFISEIIPNVRSIHESAFQWCSSLLHIEIPGEIKVIEKASFQSCSLLKQMIISFGKVNWWSSLLRMLFAWGDCFYTRLMCN